MLFCPLLKKPKKPHTYIYPDCESLLSPPFEWDVKGHIKKSPSRQGYELLHPCEKLPKFGKVKSLPGILVHMHQERLQRLTFVFSQDSAAT